MLTIKNRAGGSHGAHPHAATRPERGHSCPQERSNAPWASAMAAPQAHPGPAADRNVRAPVAGPSCGQSRAGQRDRWSLALAQLAGFLLPLALLIGCTPSGPRTLKEGKRLIDAGQYPQAVQKLKTASALLGGTNALAWAWLGLAYQHAGQAAEAEGAYQRALALNHALSEVRFNLGCLWLAQGKLEAAKTEFTACTLAQPNVAEGFLKLGVAQLRAREPSAAEKSFHEALRLSPQNPEALNGLGLTQLQRGRAAEAAQQFERALKENPDYAPALLNLAIVSHQYLRDRQFALQKYRAYLALKPPPADTDALAATVRQLELELNPPVRPAPTNAAAQLGPKTAPPKPAAAVPPRPPASNAARVVSAPRPEPTVAVPKPPATGAPKPEAAPAAPKPVAAIPPKPAATNVPKPTAPAPTAVVEAPKPAPEPAPRPASDLPKPPAPAQASAAGPSVTTSAVPASATAPQGEKQGFFNRINPLNLFRSTDKTPARPTPLGSPPPPASAASATTVSTGADSAVTPAPARVPKGPPGRYAYKSPPPPTAGDRSEAERAFAQGVQAQQAHRLAEATQAYRTATRQDPTLFEAHYNLGLVATEAGNLPLALAAYEDALAVQPRSLDARYNLALALKQANYLADACNELERVLASYPNEARAHLALGNLYAQQFGQPAKARPHYQKVLEVDPRHPQAGAVRYWLAANPP